MRDWAEYLEGTTVNLADPEPFYEKCKDYIATLKHEEFGTFHADLLPYIEKTNELEAAFRGALARVLTEAGEDPEPAWDEENYTICLESKDPTARELAGALLDLKAQTLPYVYLAAAFNERVMAELPRERW